MKRPQYYRDAIRGYVLGTHSEKDVLKACYRFYPGLASWWSGRWHGIQHSLENEDLVQVAVTETCRRLGIHGRDPSKVFDPTHPRAADPDDWVCRYASWAIQRAIEGVLKFDRRKDRLIEYIPSASPLETALKHGSLETLSSESDDFPDVLIDDAIEVCSFLKRVHERKALRGVLNDISLGLSIDQIIFLAREEGSRHGMDAGELECLVNYASGPSRRFWRMRLEESVDEDLTG